MTKSLLTIWKPLKAAMFVTNSSGSLYTIALVLRVGHFIVTHFVDVTSRVIIVVVCSVNATKRSRRALVGCLVKLINGFIFDVPNIIYCVVMSLTLTRRRMNRTAAKSNALSWCILLLLCCWSVLATIDFSPSGWCVVNRIHPQTAYLRHVLAFTASPCYRNA